MENKDRKSKDERQAPIGKLGWPLEKGRDGERTPMQWNDSANAGFSKTKPWLPVPPSYKTHNVASEQKDSNSALSFYRQLLAMRHKEPALLEGNYVALNADDPHVLTYVRRYKDEAILVVLNMSAKDQKLQFDFSPLGFSAPKLSVLLTDFHRPLTGLADALPME